MDFHFLCSYHISLNLPKRHTIPERACPQRMAESCMSLRSTQRVPRSCIPCSSRKVRCDKAEPCGTCVRRGEQHLCFRETVLIRGEPKTYAGPLLQNIRGCDRVLIQRSWHETQRDATSEALLQEIDRLREEISALRYSHESTPCSSCMTPDSRRSRQSQESDSIEDAFWSSLELKTDILGPQVSNWDDVILPSRALSNHLIAYDRMWNSWVHYAVEYPRFQQQCDDFMDATEGGLPLCDYDPFWKAVYFSLICVRDLLSQVGFDRIVLLTAPGGTPNDG